jgi:hypothetical protein
MSKFAAVYQYSQIFYLSAAHASVAYAVTLQQHQVRNIINAIVAWSTVVSKKSTATRSSETSEDHDKINSNPPSEIPDGAAPSSRSQQCMFLATWSVLVQVVLVCVLGALYPIEMTLDGTVKAPKGVHPVLGFLLNFIRYASMIAMYGGTCYLMWAKKI